MDCEQVWISDNDESSQLYKLGYIDSSDQFEYYSNNDNETIENFINLTYVNIPSIMNVLEKRYSNNNIYTFNGDILISINPFKNVNIYDKVYNVEKPHVYSICDKMYSNITKKNQSVLVSGESGSGKTENTKYMLTYLCKKYANSTLLSDKIINSNFLIELFGNAKTRRNDNSSRFGKFIKLFIKDENICGANIDKYLLEKSRISIINNNEKTYHIFYLICNNKDRLRKYNFKSIKEYIILNESDSNYDIDEFNDLDKLLSILDQFNFSNNEIDEIFYKLKLILELLNCSSSEDLHTEINNLLFTLNKLNINSEKLIEKLTTKIFITSSEKIVKPLNDEQIKVQIKSYAEDLYEKLFSNIIEKISSNLGSSSDIYMSILDIFGFEVFEDNGFEQLCINYTNEVLQQIFNEYIFKSEQLEYEKENLNWKFIEYKQNDSLIHLFNSNISIFSIINEQSILGSGSDKTIYNNFEKILKNNLFTIESIKRADNIFTIEHFTGKVDYKVDMYIKKNRIDTKLPKIKTNLQYFTNQLVDLKSELDKNACYFIRCIKPNDENRSNNFIQKKIYKQLLYSGVIEGIKIVLNGYPIKKNRIELLNEFRFFEYYYKCNLLDYFRKKEFTKEEYQVGKSKVFLKSSIYDNFYRINNKCKNDLVVTIQKYVRRLIYYKKYYYTLYKIILIQTLIRRFCANNIVKHKRYYHRSIIINKYIRCYLIHKKYKLYKTGKLIQSIIRMFLKKREYIKILKAHKITVASKLVLWYRRILVKRNILKRNKISNLNNIILKTEKELIDNKEELRNNKEELKQTKELLNKQNDIIDKLQEKLNEIESSNDYKNIVKSNPRKKLKFEKKSDYIQTKSDELKQSIDNKVVITNEKNVLVNSLELKDEIVNDFFNIPLSSDSDSDLSLTEDNIKSIKKNNLEELGSKMERLYTELHDSKQNVSSMQIEYRNLLRAYEEERYKKTFWGAIESMWVNKHSK